MVNTYHPHGMYTVCTRHVHRIYVASPLKGTTNGVKWCQTVSMGIKWCMEFSGAQTGLALKLSHYKQAGNMECCDLYFNWRSTRLS